MVLGAERGTGQAAALPEAFPEPALSSDVIDIAPLSSRPVAAAATAVGQGYQFYGRAWRTDFYMCLCHMLCSQFSLNVLAVSLFSCFLSLYL